MNIQKNQKVPNFDNRKLTKIQAQKKNIRISMEFVITYNLPFWKYFSSNFEKLYFENSEIK
mgnify:CR=1 FL=1